MAKKRAKKTPNQIAYEKELKRINAFIRSAEKRGFRFDKSFLPSKRPSRYTQSQIQKLKELTAPKLYTKATYMTEEGKIVSGGRGRTLERKKSAQKTANKKKRTQREQGAADAASIIIDNMYSLFDMFPTAGANYLRKAFDRQINKYGKTKVARSLARMPEEAVKTAQEVVFYQKDAGAHNRAIKRLMEMITGEILTDEELKELGNIADQMDFMDYED